MKIEKINENQIKCTLTRSDLESRDINIKELAYGNDKARRLFSDMVREACSQFEFTTDHVPIMIEAVPVQSEGLVILITKVDNPDEVDPHFAKFAPSVLEHSELLSDETGPTLKDVLGRFKDMIESEHLLDQDKVGTEKSFKELLESKLSLDISTETSTIGGPARELLPAHGKADYAEPVPEDQQEDASRAFIFASLDEIKSVARVARRIYSGETSLYRNPRSGHFYLVIHKGSNDPKVFNKICNTITEYGAQVKVAFASESYYREHYETVFAGDALTAIK